MPAMTFRAPVDDLAFSLMEVAGARALMEGGAFPDFDVDILRAVLEAGAALADGVLAPIDAEGDRVGARLENGTVVTPPGFRDAYRAYAEGGWVGLSADPAFGGQGLPRALSLAVFEMVNAANMSFALAPILSGSAIEALAAHGNDRQKALYLPRLISGEWSGTMNLTESQSGSDLGLIRTRAEPDGDHWRLTGEKIFITWGDHDCAENIVHLVLARLPDAPEGVKGISLFLAPKRLVDGDGKLGAANGLRPGSLEHKLGIHASPTCVMLFEGAQAELVGRPNEGLAHMFTMMNAARLNVGAQGVGVAERAYQRALAYALDRRQGRSPWSAEAPARIFDHPDIRRRLALTKARIEAARGICLSTAVAADLAQTASDPQVREAARLREELLTPIAKAWSTDLGVDAASEGLQIHGGMGYIEETGAAQHYRDARIATIYEGTNAIQALDLVGRKLAMGEGAAVRALTSDIRATVAAMDGAPAKRLEAGVAALETATAWMLAHHGSDDALAGACAYLKLAGDVAGGWMLAKGALAGEGHRQTLLSLYAEQILSGAPGLAEAVVAGAGGLVDMTPEDLGA
jgi:alkylation response protein AidB-like acyl-CoA dehydrogenase